MGCPKHKHTKHTYSIQTCTSHMVKHPETMTCLCVSAFMTMISTASSAQSMCTLRTGTPHQIQRIAKQIVQKYDLKNFCICYLHICIYIYIIIYICILYTYIYIYMYIYIHNQYIYIYIYMNHNNYPFDSHPSHKCGKFI